MTPRYGYLLVADVVAITRQKVEIVAEFTTRYRIRALDRTKIAHGEPWLKAGGEALVPKAAIEPIEPEPSS
jgi:hypothetical protein